MSKRRSICLCLSSEPKERQTSGGGGGGGGKRFVHFREVVYKWKNHFYEMKGDVGMSVHEKERKQEDAYTKTQTHS